MKITDIITEAASPAQQAAIAVSMKKAGKKPRSVDEDLTRRGFLRGLGAAAVAGAAGSALAGSNDPNFVRKVHDQHNAMMEKNPRYAKEHDALGIYIARGIAGASAENNKRWVEKTAQLLQKYGVKVNEGVAEGSGESYMIIRTDAEGKKDVFAGNFDTYEQAQKELDGLLAHPLHTKYKQKFEIKRKGGEQGVAEDAVSDFIARGGQIQQGKLHKPRKGETWQGSSHIGAAGGRGTKGTVSGKAANTNPKGGKPVVSAEGYNPEYDDEAGMADNNLETLQRAVEGIDDLIQSGDNLPEWCQEKIAVAKSMLVAVWDYMYSEEASDEVDPEVDEMFEAMQELVAEMAVKNRVSEDLVWEQFEAMPDNVLYETAAWRRKEGKSKKGGLNAKGVASYRRENPGSKLQMAVTTKPSKLKKGSKAAKRRKSFCARMSGVKGPMKKPNGKPTRKALALRKWNC
jgi:hypothetical protein